MTLSVIIPVSERASGLPGVLTDYRSVLDGYTDDYEVIVVLDGQYPELRKSLEALRQEGKAFTIVQLAKSFGEATALSVGFQHAKGEKLLVLPPYKQIESSEIPRLIDSLENQDMVCANRYPRSDSWLNRLQAKTFNWLISLLTGSSFNDLGCGVRVLKRQVLEEVAMYGDQHRFLPLLARHAGFNVTELPVKQSTQDLGLRLYRPGVYFRRALDVLTVFFLVKFTKKPLRFFGLVGGAITAIGAVLFLILLSQRIFWGMPLADRPALLISSLVVVLGVQLFAIGLVGELIIFTHARDLREYSIEEVIN